MDKIIKNFNLDLSDIQEAGENRAFSIIADNGAEFILQIKDATTDYYYNFTTNAFQAAQTDLESVVVNGVYNGIIEFPSVTGSDDQYDIYLHAKPGTKHVVHTEVRFADNSIDINSSTGSNSLMMKKVIYQYTDLTLTISKYSLNGTIEGTGSDHVDDTISVPRGRGITKASFTVKAAASVASKSYKIIKQPTPSDILSYDNFTVGSDPEILPGENILDAVDEIYTTIFSSNKTHSSTSISNTTTVTMALTIEDIGIKVGDRVRINSGTDFSNIVTVSAIEGGGLSSTQFTVSENVTIGTSVMLDLYHRLYHQWPIDNIDKVQKGISAFSTNISSGTHVANWENTITIFEGTENEEVIVKDKANFKDTKNQNPTIVKGLVTAQPGNIIFNKAQSIDLAGDSIKLFGRGESQAQSLSGYDVRFTDLAIKLTDGITTTTTSAVVDSTTVPVASVNGILPSTTTVSGIGIDASVSSPTVTSRSVTSGAGNIVLDAAQTLESGITLTLADSGQIATITGNIEIVKAGTADKTIYFDLERLLSIA